MSEQQIPRINGVLGGAIASQFGRGFEKVLCFVYDDESEAILGFFSGRSALYRFEISSNGVLAFERLVPDVHSVAPASFRRGFEEARRTDGVQIKKKCQPGVSIPCGESCIPEGAICRQGLPTGQQARVMAVRATLKAGRAVSRAAAIATLAVGATALASYAAKRAADENLGEKVAQAAQRVGIDRATTQKMQNFASQVADRTLPKDVREAVAQGKNQAEVRRYQERSRLQKIGDRLSFEIRQNVNDYVTAWKTAPIRTAYKHATVGLVLVGVEQLGERLGYVPQGTLERSLRSRGVNAKWSWGALEPIIKRPKTEPRRVTSRNPDWGA